MGFEFHLNRIVHPIINICWEFTHSQSIQAADEFKQIWRNVALHDLLTWMGAVRIRVQTAYINNKEYKLHKMLINGLELCGLLDYRDIFISCLDSHSDGTHSVQRIHWWVSDVMLHFSKSVLMKKQTHLNLRWAWGWIHFQYISVFGFRMLLTCLVFPPLAGAVCMAFMISTGHNLHSAILRERLRK